MTVLLDEQTILSQLTVSPRLPEFLRRLQRIVADETAQRQAFYAQINEDDKAEYINGQVIYHSPVKLRHHAAAKRLFVLLDTYVTRHQLGVVGYEKLMISLTRNDYEPDLCFFGQEKALFFTPDQMRFPAPDLVVEVLSHSTEEKDRGVKFMDYADHGVAEYWIVDPDAETLEQYRLVAGQFELVSQGENGVGEQLLRSLGFSFRSVPCSMMRSTRRRCVSCCDGAPERE